jgi:hypothetical protein
MAPWVEVRITIGQRFWVSYGFIFSGNTMGFVINSGRIAGKWIMRPCGISFVFC